MDVKITLKIHSQQKLLKTFCESLREHTMKIINFKKKKMKFLTNEQQSS